MWCSIELYHRLTMYIYIFSTMLSVELFLVTMNFKHMLTHSCNTIWLQTCIVRGLSNTGLYSTQVLLSSDSNAVASVSINRCSVYVTDENSVTGLVFPVDPVVVSLKNYDNADTIVQPINGYPLVCITVSIYDVMW